jgi:hypothetical protein
MIVAFSRISAAGGSICQDGRFRAVIPSELNVVIDAVAVPTDKEPVRRSAVLRRTFRWGRPVGRPEYLHPGEPSPAPALPVIRPQGNPNWWLRNRKRPTFDDGPPLMSGRSRLECQSKSTPRAQVGQSAAHPCGTTFHVDRPVPPRCRKPWRSVVRRQPAPDASGWLMSRRSPKNVIVVNGAPKQFARACESLLIGPDYRSVKRSDRGFSRVTLRDLIEREREGT